METTYFLEHSVSSKQILVRVLTEHGVEGTVIALSEVFWSGLNFFSFKTFVGEIGVTDLHDAVSFVER